MKLTPLFDRVVLSDIELNSKGILLPSSAKEKPVFAKVVSVGKGGIVDGEKVEIQVNIGDTVVYNKYATSEVEIEGQKFYIIKQTDILAIVEKGE